MYNLLTKSLKILLKNSKPIVHHNYCEKIIIQDYIKALKTKTKLDIIKLILPSHFLTLQDQILVRFFKLKIHIKCANAKIHSVLI